MRTSIVADPHGGPQHDVPSSKEYAMDRKELIFFIAIGGLVLVALAAVVSRFV